MFECDKKKMSEVRKKEQKWIIGDIPTRSKDGGAFSFRFPIRSRERGGGG